MSFDTAFDRVVGHEGGFQNDPADRGNWTTGVIGKGKNKGTKFGIAAMSYPDLDIVNLTEDQARTIYYRDFWEKYRCDEYDWAIGFQMFDAAINHGPGNAARMLQKAVGVVDDGNIGPRTVAAVNAMSVSDVLLRFLAFRLKFMTDISTFEKYGRGWSRRIVTNLLHGAEDSD